MVAYLASYFVPPGAAIFNTFHTRGASESEAPVVDPTGPRRLDVPLFILVNGGTGSASESFSYTLQAGRRATIVGEPTNGRANPGRFVPVGEGFAVFVSGGSPENPITHGNWEGTGVLPDIAAPSADALQEAQATALRRLLANAPAGPTAAEYRWLLSDLHANGGSQVLQGYVGDYGEQARTTDEHGTLVLHQGRRKSPLRQVAPDVFVSQVDPLMHVRFERQDHRIVALTLATPAAVTARYARSSNRT